MGIVSSVVQRRQGSMRAASGRRQGGVQWREGCVQRREGAFRRRRCSGVRLGAVCWQRVGGIQPA